MLTYEQFLAFGKAVDAECIDLEGGTRLVLDWIEDDDAVPAEIEWNDEDETISVTSYGDGSFRTEHVTRAPAVEWRVTQSVDDHNLVTTLECGSATSPELTETGSNVKTRVSVRGPPASCSPEGIQVEGASTDQYVLDS